MMNDMSHKENANTTSLEDLINKYNSDFIEHLRLLEKTKEKYEEIEATYKNADDEAYHAEKEAEDAYATYKMAEEITQALLIKEEEARLTVELALTLANDGAAKQISENNDLRELLIKTLENMQQDSIAAKEQLAQKREARLNAEKEQTNLNLLAAIARLKAGMANAKRAEANEMRIDRENRLQITEAENKINLAQLESLQLFDNAQKTHNTIESLLAEGKELSERADNMSKPEQFIAGIKEDLVQKLSSTGQDLLPYEKDVLLAESKEQKAEDLYTLAIEEEKTLQSMAAKRQLEADELDRDAKIIAESTSCEYEKITESCKNSLSIATAKINTLKEDSVKSWQNVDEAEQNLAKVKKELAEAKATRAELEENIFKARTTSDELSRMLTTSQSSQLLSGTGTISNTLEQAKQEIIKQTQELEKVNIHISELAKEPEIFTNTVRNARAAAIDIEKTIAIAEADFAALEKELNAQLNSGKASMQQIRGIAAERAKHAHQLAKKSQEAVVDAKEKVKQLENDFTAAKSARIKAEKKRNAARAKINSYIQQVQQEANQAITAHEQEMLLLWERSERLRLDAAEKKSELESILATAHNVASKENQSISALKSAVTKANLRINDARQHTAMLLDQYRILIADINIIINSIKALDSGYEKNAGKIITDAANIVDIANQHAERAAAILNRQEYTVNIPQLAIPSLDFLNLSEPAASNKPSFDALPVATQLTQMITELAAKYSAEAAADLANFLAKQPSYEAVLPVTTPEPELLSPADNNEDSLLPPISNLEELNEEQRAMAIADAAKTAFVQEMKKTMPADDLNGQYFSIEETPLIEPEQQEDDTTAEPALELPTPSAAEEPIDAPPLPIADEQDDAAIVPLDITEDEHPAEDESPAISEEQPEIAPEQAISAEEELVEEALTETVAEMPADLKPPAEQAELTESIEKQPAAEPEQQPVTDDTEPAVTGPIAAILEQNVSEAVISEPMPAIIEEVAAPDELVTQNEPVAENEAAVETEQPSPAIIEPPHPVEEPIEEPPVIDDTEPEQAEAESLPADIVSIPEQATEQIEQAVVAEAAYPEQSAPLPQEMYQQDITANDATLEQPIATIAETANIAAAIPAETPLVDNTKQKRGLFGRKKGQANVPPAVAEEPILPAEPVAEIIPQANSSAPIPAESNVDLEKQQLQDNEANRISAEIEAMRLKLAAVTYEQRKEQEELENKRKAEEDELRRQAEAESARIRAEEEAALKIAAEGAARKEEELRQAALAAEQLAEHAVEQINAMPNETQTADHPASASMTAASNDDDIDTDLEIELRRLILSDLQKK